LQICEHCLTFIRSWYAFRLKCQDVDRAIKASQPIKQSEACALFTPKMETSVRHQCLLCPDSFAFSEDLTSHIQLLHTVLSADESSQQENKNENQLQVSVRQRLSKLKLRLSCGKRFSCDVCGRTDFISKETLKRHRRLHSGRYTCKSCFKRFTCNAILRIHERDKHENDKPFVCDVCGKPFVTELLLRYHQRFHTGEYYFC